MDINHDTVDTIYVKTLFDVETNTILAKLLREANLSEMVMRDITEYAVSPNPFLHASIVHDLLECYECLQSEQEEELLFSDVIEDFENLCQRINKKIITYSEMTMSLVFILTSIHINLKTKTMLICFKRLTDVQK